MAILGISTNTRLLGLAVIKQGKLVDYSIHLHKSPWSAAKADTIITSLEPCVRQYCIKRVVLSIPHAYHQTEAFRVLLARLQAYFEAINIPVYTKPLSTLLTLCPPDEKKTKKALMKALCQQFPDLTYCHSKELRNKNRYYIKIFEAVAAAVLQSQV